jgi:hypothetical protein
MCRARHQVSHGSIAVARLRIKKNPHMSVMVVRIGFPRRQALEKLLQRRRIRLVAQFLQLFPRAFGIGR